MRALLTAALVCTLAAPAAAQQQPSPLSGIAFLAGDWSAGRGAVADTGQTSTGTSHIELANGGAGLLRRDTTQLFDKAGKPAGSFTQIMMVYPEDGTLHADYSDGTHVIHYRTAEIVAGHSVTFTSAAVPGAPTFRLAYVLTAPRTLAVHFAAAAPGSGDFHPIADGTLTRTP